MSLDQSSRAMDLVDHDLIFFTGHVQGVGFRYSTLQVSREYEVSGYVRNLPDGRVQLEVEGARAEIDAFVEELSSRMHGYIRKVERSARKSGREFAGFSIR